MAVQITRRLFTVDEFEQMGQAGILREDDRVELVEGEIIEMSPIGPRHAGGVNRLVRLFGSILGDRAIASPQNPVRLDGLNEPLPDLSLLRPRADFYATSHPRTEDALLIVEISDTTVAFDGEVKAGVYARTGVPEYWQVNLTADHVRVFRDPTPDGYGLILTARRGELISPLAFPEMSFSVADLLG
jgi:Uma2 family endonuclease